MRKFIKKWLLKNDYEINLQKCTIILLISILAIFFIGNKANAELKTVYIPVKADAPIEIAKAKTIALTQEYWNDANDLYAAIDIYKDFGSDALRKAIDHFIAKGTLELVAKGYISVIYSHEYNGYYIYILDR